MSADKGHTDGREDNHHDQAQQDQQVLGADIHPDADNEFGDDDTHHHEGVGAEGRFDIVLAASQQVSGMGHLTCAEQQQRRESDETGQGFTAGHAAPC